MQTWYHVQFIFLGVVDEGADSIHNKHLKTISVDVLDMAKSELTNPNSIIFAISLQLCSPKIPLSQKFN